MSEESFNSVIGNVNIDFNIKKKEKMQKQQEVNNKLISGAKKEIPVKIAALGGLEEVGKNMMFIEYRSDIIIIDAGMLMPGYEMLGIDYIIPDVSYLKARKHKIRGLLITHGHLDHIWAIKHILPELDYPPIYTTPLAAGLIKKLMEWFVDPEKVTFNMVNPDVDILKLGVFTIEFFRVNHSIPEAMGMAIHTPKWLVVHTGDFKIDFTPAVDLPADLAKIARTGSEGVKLLFADSTNATKPGRTPSEKQIWESLEKIIKEVNGRLIIATFSSLVGRIKQIIDYAVKYNKVVFLSGRSMINNVEVAKELGYIKVPAGTIRQLNSDVEAMPDDRVVILTTWSQGEEFSALARIARGEHPQIKVREGDKILLSASPIAGNERSVHDMINALIRKWAEVFTNKELDLHVSGHGYQDDLKLMLSLVRPEYFIPVHGEIYMRNAHKKLAQELGIPEENIFLPDNGQFIELYSDKIEISPKKIKLDTVMIDGLGIGHLSGEYVMKAREIMSEDGVVSLIFKVDSVTKELVGNLQIESRGFVYSSEVKKIHTNIVEFTKKRYQKYLKQDPSKPVKEILKQIKEDLNDYLTKTVGRTPMLILSFVYINRNPSQVPNWNWDEDDVVGMTLEEQWWEAKIYSKEK